MNLRLLVLLLAGIGFLGDRASAGPVLTWDWSYLTTTTAGVSYSGSGTLTTGAAPDIDGNYTILGIGGIWTSSLTGSAAITGLSDFFGASNLLNVTTGPLVTASGFSFDDSLGASVNIYTVDLHVSPYVYAAIDSASNADLSAVFSVLVIPEPMPSTLAIFGLGLLAVVRFRLRTRAV